MADHSPGAWTLLLPYIYDRENPFPIATVSGAKIDANARLMVAAPDMLEVLEWIERGDWNDGPGSWAVLDRRVSEAIAKAKGG